MQSYFTTFLPSLREIPKQKKNPPFSTVELPKNGLWKFIWQKGILHISFRTSVDAYTVFKDLATEICLALFLDVDESTEFHTVKAAATLHWHGVYILQCFCPSFSEPKILFNNYLTYMLCCSYCSPRSHKNVQFFFCWNI